MWLYYRGGKGNGNTRMSRRPRRFVLIETPKRTSSTIRTETVLIWYFNTNYSTIYSPNDLPAADAAAAIAPSLSPEQTSSEFLLLNPTVQIHPPLSLGTRSFVGEASAAHSFPLHSSPLPTIPWVYRQNHPSSDDAEIRDHLQAGKKKKNGHRFTKLKAN